jgi:hypothetical protein
MRSLALRTLIASIAISALLGIYVLVVGNFGDLETRVLVSALCVSGLSVLTMACGGAFERGRLGILPQLGMTLSSLSFVLFMVGIWTESDAEPLWKSALSAAMLGTAAAHACLLSLAALTTRFRWVPWVAYGSALLIVATVLGLIWDVLPESDGIGRFVGVLAILLAAVTITVPILHRMDGSVSPTVSTPSARSIRFCVACGQPLEEKPGMLECQACGSTFRVEWIPADLDSGD